MYLLSEYCKTWVSGDHISSPCHNPSCFYIEWEREESPKKERSGCQAGRERELVVIMGGGGGGYIGSTHVSCEHTGQWIFGE